MVKKVSSAVAKLDIKRALVMAGGMFVEQIAENNVSKLPLIGGLGRFGVIALALAVAFFDIIPSGLPSDMFIGFMAFAVFKLIAPMATAIV